MKTPLSVIRRLITISIQDILDQTSQETNVDDDGPNLGSRQKRKANDDLIRLRPTSIDRSHGSSQLEHAD